MVLNELRITSLRLFANEMEAGGRENGEWRMRNILEILCIPVILLLTMSCSDPELDNPLDKKADSYVGNDLSSSSDEQFSSSGEGESSSSSSYSKGLFCDVSSIIGNTKVGESISKPEVRCDGEIVNENNIYWENAPNWSNLDSAQTHTLRAEITTGDYCLRESVGCGELVVERGEGAEVVGLALLEDSTKGENGEYMVKVKYSSLNLTTGQEVECSNDSGSNWYDYQNNSCTFDGYSAGQEYSIIARTKENNNYEIGKESPPLTGKIPFCLDFKNENKEVCDKRDNKKYNYVEIGEQTWMAENLNYWGDGESVGKCYGDSADNCDKYGRLYDWITAMNFSEDCYDSSCQEQIKNSSHQGICPEGWHLPSNAEWKELVDYVESEECSDDKNCAAQHLKAENDWTNCSPGCSTYCCEDSYNFTALPGGYGTINNEGGTTFSGLPASGGWWSASEGSARTEYAHHITMRNSQKNVDMHSQNPDNKTSLRSVRCVRNN